MKKLIINTILFKIILFSFTTQIYANDQSSDVDLFGVEEAKPSKLRNIEQDDKNCSIFGKCS